MTSPTRWAGVPLSDRRAERRTRLVEAAYTLFGLEGEAAVTVRSVCRVCELNSRYFYESFTTTNELLGAVYDHVAMQLGEAVGNAMMAADEDRKAQTRAGIRAVLWFSAADPRRGRVMFTDGRANSALAERRTAAQDLLFQMVVEDDERVNADVDPVAARVGGAVHRCVERTRPSMAGGSTRLRPGYCRACEDVSATRRCRCSPSRRRRPGATPAEADRGPSRRRPRTVLP
jgi:AcrR family transcriptional regulator